MDYASVYTYGEGMDHGRINIEFGSPKVTQSLSLDLDRCICSGTNIKVIPCIPPRAGLARILIGRSRTKPKDWVTLGDPHPLSEAVFCQWQWHMAMLSVIEGEFQILL